jgi:hypothetical protein
MKFKIQIHKHKIYISPRPQKDIPEGLVIVLNKPRGKGMTEFISTDINENQKEYDLPELPEGYFIKGGFYKKGNVRKS